MVRAIKFLFLILSQAKEERVTEEKEARQESARARRAPRAAQSALDCR